MQSKIGVVKPFGQRVAVIDPPAEEQYRDSGLIIVSEEMEIAKGVIVDTGEDEDQTDEQEVLAMALNLIAISVDDRLKKGMLVYYHKHSGTRIGDVRIIELSAIVAYENA